ncbi:MAG: hypothetical protein L6R37_004934 [Teloschistes peruensis]|nr:MAG: hypothetical protein L6R37_004934 [Teloschistes peruensis]
MADALPTPESNQENAQPAAKGRGRGKAATNVTTNATTNATARPKPKARRTSAGSLTGGKKATSTKPGPKRAPLKEQWNNTNPEDTEEVDDFDRADEAKGKGHQSAVSADELVAVKQPVKKPRAVPKGRKSAEKKPTDQEKLQLAKATANDGEFEYTPVAARQTKPPKKGPGRPPANKSKAIPEPPAFQKIMSEKVIPDTQDIPMEIEPSQIPLQSEEEEEVPQSVFRRTNNTQATARARHPLQTRKQFGAGSDTEQGVGDLALRKKLGDMTKQLDSLNLKYKKLADVGIKEAEANFEKLKQSSEAKTKGMMAWLRLSTQIADGEIAANELIASLRKEVATQKALAEESRTLQGRLAEKDKDVSKTQALATELSNALGEAQNENKVLQAKLSSARSASTTIESANAKTPGSAMKGNVSVRTVMVGSAEAAQAAQVAQLKEDLYRDLTGLLVLGVEKGSEVDVFDCIQTGRNGTLHFKLGIATNTEGSYEETDFQYTPRLDQDRDRDLLELLPDYLSEEITFSRLNAGMFYGRVVETLMKKRAEDREA